MRIRATLSGLVLAIGGFGLAAALASASPGSQQYHKLTVTTRGDVGGTKGAHATLTTTGNVHGSLPFTGMSLVWIVVAGVMLVLLGLALRRRGRRSSS